MEESPQSQVSNVAINVAINVAWLLCAAQEFPEETVLAIIHESLKTANRSGWLCMLTDHVDVACIRFPSRPTDPKLLLNLPPVQRSAGKIATVGDKSWNLSSH